MMIIDVSDRSDIVVQFEYAVAMKKKYLGGCLCFVYANTEGREENLIGVYYRDFMVGEGHFFLMEGVAPALVPYGCSSVFYHTVQEARAAFNKYKSKNNLNTAYSTVEQCKQLRGQLSAVIKTRGYVIEWAEQERSLVVDVVSTVRGCPCYLGYYKLENTKQGKMQHTIYLSELVGSQSRMCLALRVL